MRVHRSRRFAHARIVDGVVAETDVAGDRAGKQMDVLQHEPEQPAQLAEIHLADVDAVDQNTAAVTS